MDPAAYRSLAERGLLVSGPSGGDAVRVYVQLIPDVDGDSREARRAALVKRFEDVAKKYSDAGVEVDPSSISVGGQMIEAVVPVATYDEATRSLEDDGFRVDVAEPFDAAL